MRQELPSSVLWLGQKFYKNKSVRKGEWKGESGKEEQRRGATVGMAREQRGVIVFGQRGTASVDFLDEVDCWCGLLNCNCVDGGAGDKESTGVPGFS